jgi:hypothetical protein
LLVKSFFDKKLHKKSVHNLGFLSGAARKPLPRADLRIWQKNESKKSGKNFPDFRSQPFTKKHF